MIVLRAAVLVVAAAACLSIAVEGRKPPLSGGVAAIESASLKQWLTYIASDQLEGREIYTEGLGLAASYIVRHLAESGVQPAGEDGTYFQPVKVLSVRNTGRSSVTVVVNGRSRTFSDGDGIAFPVDVGPSRRIEFEDAVFVGYGVHGRPAGRGDAARASPTGRAIVWLGLEGPGNASEAVRLPGARMRSAIDAGAAAVIGPAATTASRSHASSDDRESAASADFVTTRRLDVSTPPAIEAGDEFFEFLFSGSPVKYQELKELAWRRQPLPRFALTNVKMSIDVDANYTVRSTRLSRNVVAVIPGTDPRLRDTYVAFGAHYDHIGYQHLHASARSPGQDPGGCTGQTRPRPRADDVINNGADDDGSGTVALMAIARAFAKGPRPRRSLLFVWHTGEESGLHGSRYNADHPVVPNERIIAQLNVDMVGRNRCDRRSEGNTVYLVGSDRISTDLHNLSEDANAAMARPLTLDYELNDPADPQSLYTRSDHYSYAAKGIPVIFYTTGLHRDYHYLTDEVDKIEWDKLTRVTELIYTTGQRLANLERAPARDHKGPRMGKGSRGKIQ